MEIKATVGKFQAINWFKGAILVIIGLLHSRFDVGFNWFLDNLVLGPIVYFLIMVSGMLVTLALKMPQEESKSTFQRRDVVKMASVIIFLITYGIISYYVYFYERTVLILVLLGIIGFWWGLTLLYGADWEYKDILRIFIIGFSLSFGIIYAALLNDLSIPGYLYFFVLGTFTLQFTKDILKSCKVTAEIRGESENYKSLANTFTIHKTQNIALVLQALTILFLTLPFIAGLYNYFLYLFPMIIASIFIGISIVLNLIYDLEDEYNGKVFILLRLSMVFVITAFFFASI